MNNFDKYEATQKMKKSIDSFKKEIGPQESIIIDLHWKATSEGKFSDYIDFCINPWLENWSIRQ